MNIQPVRYKAKAFEARNLIFLFLIILLLCAAPASAAPSNEAIAMPTYTLGDPQELEKFMDSAMKSQLSEQNIAGAVVVVVQDDQVLLAKGYGYADVEKQIPVDAVQTMFRAGSVTKLFTWTAVMQLAEQGKLDLQADVNTYLTKFQVPDTYPQPITMLDLMSHTAGFGEISWRLGQTPLEELTSLEEFLQEYMPERIYPPGKLLAYSNYGTSLAGYIVEQVSGEPYEQYVETHILQPLGMAHSTMHQPLPREMVPDMAQGYLFINGAYQPLPLERFYNTPASALVASGVDMGKFMLAHLKDGGYDGARILQPETARLMHTQSYTFDPTLPGWAHGFEEQIVNGWRLIGHGGDVAGFRTLLRLIPEEKVGLYVAFNSANVGDARETLLQMFMDRYFPAPQSEGDPAGNENASLTGNIPLDHYTGFYTDSSVSYQDPRKIWAWSSMLWIRPGPNNTLQKTYLLGLSVEGTWVPVQPMVFQYADTGALVIFKADEQGQVRYMRDSGSIASAVIRIKQPWYGGQVFHFGLLVFSLLTFLLTVISAVVAFFISLRKRVASRRSPWQSRLARGLALALCLAFIYFVAIFIQKSDNPLQPIILIMAWLIAILSAGVTLMAIAAWWKGWWGLAGRLHYTLVALAALAILWFEIYWKLLPI
jgi:CubicO group peptidase (beta-lactamase class C family)